MKKYLPYFFGFLSFLIPFTLYVWTLAPTYIPIDSAEFAMCMATWGVCHPPGFPLYTMLGKLFIEVLPIGSVIYKANLFSAVFGAGTVLFIFLSLRVLAVRMLYAFGLALIFAVSFTFWEFSLAADVFTFGSFLIVLSFYFVFLKRFYPAVFVLGLSASHFYITAILAPVFYWYFWGFKFNHDFGLHFRRLLMSAIVFVSGLFPQAVMYWRMLAGPEINWSHVKNLEDFIYFVRRQEFGSIFLLSNPALTFGIDKVFYQFREYFISLFSSFAVILVLVAPLGLLTSDGRKKRVYFLWISYFVILIVQLVLLGTIDPGGEGNPFQLNKFYLSSFVIFIFLIGLSLESISRKFFDDESVQVLFLLTLLFFVLFVSNFRTLNYSKNNFSQNFVLDALDQVPGRSLLITVDHLVYFGTLYEQKVNNRHTDKTILYFPNEKNRDNEGYNPEVFSGEEDKEFINAVMSKYQLGDAEKYVLSTISRNLDRDIYILQGEFEYNFFRYLADVSEPHGLWWRVNEGERSENSAEILRKFDSLRNNNFKRRDFFLKQQDFEAAVYAVSYYTSALRLAELGDYDNALALFGKSLAIDGGKTNVQNDIDLVEKIRGLDSRRREFIGNKDARSLIQLGEYLSVIKNYEDSAVVFEEVIRLGKDQAVAYNNAASAYANLGNLEKAGEYFEKALEFNPNLDQAKKGLEAIRSLND